MLAVIILTGSVLQYALKKYPQLRDIVNLIDSDRIYPKVDINAASAEELVTVPYIGEYTAKNIVQYRQINGPFTKIEQIKSVKGIRDKNYEKFYRYLTVNKPRWFVWGSNTNPRGLFTVPQEKSKWQ